MATVTDMKPDWATAPDWAQWVAQDDDGSWWWFQTEPENVDGLWVADGDEELALAAPDRSDTKESKPS
jgi:hypothetical protein